MNIIYKTINLINNKFYVGKHTQDEIEFDGYLGSGLLIMKAIEKYGKENFIRETLEETHTEEIAFEREIYWIDCLSASDLSIGYNLTKGGEGFTSEYIKKLWENQEYRDKVLESKIDFYNDPGYKLYRSALSKEMWQRPGHKELMSHLNTISHNTAEYKEMQSEVSKLRWADPIKRQNILDGMIIRDSNPEYLEKRSQIMIEK